MDSYPVYMLKLDREMLNLGAVEIDRSLIKALEDSDQKSGTIELINKKDVIKAFEVDTNENLIQGKGIKTFFSGYEDGYLFAEAQPDGRFRVISGKLTSIQTTNPDTIERAFLVLDALRNFVRDDEKWFDIYNRSKDFITDTGYDRLLCLPHLRDLEMFEYQIKTVRSVLNKFHGRVLLCDEVGLGKTVEAGMAMLEYIMRGMVKKILVLVPPSLVDQWYYEMRRKFNQDFIRYDDPQFKEAGDNAWHRYSKVIASLSTAKRKNNSDIISKIHYDLIIVDEAHHLKNRKSLSWQFVNSLNKKYIFLLTATPVQNNLEELYNLITLLKPGQLKTYSYFKKNFISDREGLEVKNNNYLRELVTGVMIRNRRSDVDIKFTKRKAVTIGLNLLPNEKELYDDISSFIRQRYQEDNSILTRFVLKSLQEEMGSSFYAVIETLSKMMLNEKLPEEDKTKLEQFHSQAVAIEEKGRYNNLKLRQLLKIISEFNDKIIVFTKYKRTQELIVDFLKNNSLKVAQFHGGQRRVEKEEQIQYFKEDACIFVSTEAGGEGRNLQFCNCMVNFDLPWNPMAIEQRIGRIHRVGQMRDVFVYNLAAKGTLESYILDLLDRKINMFEMVVGEVDMILGDIEENTDFSDIIMNTWVNSNSSEKMQDEIERLGERLLENKRQYMKVKELDDRLFSDALKSSEEGD